MEQQQTLYWYDLETFGTHTQHDRIAQFAGVRTNRSFEVIDEPLILYIRIPEDYLPDPLACLVTGITPQETLEKGISEYDAAKRILKEFSRRGTCVIGYNSVRFDDEFIRNLFYRNFLDPYQREYANGNSRWDIIDLVRAAHDLRPDGMQWPVNEKGHPSFRLEDLTRENNIGHDHAHDALSDVFATMAVAKSIYTAQKDLFLYSFRMRKKQRLKNLIHLPSMKPLLYTAPLFTRERGCTTMIAPLTVDPKNSNSLICFDLRQDPEHLVTCAPSRLRDEVPLVHVALNKCPFLAPVSTLDDASAERLDIDRDLCISHLRRLQARHDIPIKVRAAYEHSSFEEIDDPDYQIYSGGFFSDADRKRFSHIHSIAPREILDEGMRMRFDDARIHEMLWRFVCRNFPEVLTPAEQQRWSRHTTARILFPPGDSLVDMTFYKRKIKQRAASPETPSRDKLIMKALEEYGRSLEEKHLTG